MKITGHAADMRETLKEHRTKGYENKTILEIVTDIAGRHGLTPAVNAQIGAFVNDYVAQQGESDMHFLTRLAKRHDCIFKVANGRLIFVPRGEAASASGLSMPNVTITPDMVKAYEATFKDRPAFQKTYATWWDRKKAKLNKEESDDQQNDETSGESAVDADFGVRHQHPNKDVAKATANAKQAENDKDTRTMTITVYGDAEIRAEATLTVQGVRDRVNDQWRVKQVTHSIMNESGFLSIVDCEKPGNGAIGN